MNTIFYLNFQNTILFSILSGCLKNQKPLHSWLQEIQTISCFGGSGSKGISHSVAIQLNRTRREGARARGLDASLFPRFMDGLWVGQPHWDHYSGHSEKGITLCKLVWSWNKNSCHIPGPGESFPKLFWFPKNLSPLIISPGFTLHLKYSIVLEHRLSISLEEYYSLIPTSQTNLWVPLFFDPFVCGYLYPRAANQPKQAVFT